MDGTRYTGARRNIYKILNPYDGYDPAVRIRGRRGTIGNRRVDDVVQVHRRQHLRIHQARIDTATTNRSARFSRGICKFPVSLLRRLYVAPSAVASHKHGYVIRAQLATRLAPSFPLTIEVGPIATDGRDVTVRTGTAATFHEIHEIFNRIIDSLRGPRECSSS